LKAAFERFHKPPIKISGQNFDFYGFKNKTKMAISDVKIALEISGFDQKLIFCVLFSFAHVGNLGNQGQRSRSLICSRKLLKIIKFKKKYF
jgi:hypothetical protein